MTNHQQYARKCRKLFCNISMKIIIKQSISSLTWLESGSLSGDPIAGTCQYHLVYSNKKDFMDMYFLFLSMFEFIFIFILITYIFKEERVKIWIYWFLANFKPNSWTVDKRCLIVKLIYFYRNSTKSTYYCIHNWCPMRNLHKVQWAKKVSEHLLFAFSFLYNFANHPC